MNIVVCCKLVPEEQDIQVKGDRSISYDSAERKIGDYDLVAIEAAVQLAESCEGSVHALSIGDESLNNSKLRKAILSRGADDLTICTGVVPDQLDSFQTAMLLKQAIEKMSDIDVVICGEGSADIYAQQVGIMLGELLGWTTVNAVSNIESKDGVLVVGRALDDRNETLGISLPAAISVAADYAEARIVSMKEILAAGKKPIDDSCVVERSAVPESGADIVSVLAPESRKRAEVIVEGNSDEQIDQFVEALSAKL